MRQFRRFLIPPVTLFFCSIFILIALAQEKLPEIIKKIEPSIVVILTYGKDGKMIGQGSGFFISQSGDIITNRHVLIGVHRAEIKTARGKVYPITLIVAEDKAGDVIRASVNIPKESVHPLSLGSSIPEVGERVAVIGSPLGLERTVSDGIVSAVREIPAFGNIYQITAPISPGSSGSPVVNMKGEVIGVATFQFVGGQNLNFAIPGERIAKLKKEKGKTLDQWKMGEPDEWLVSAEGLNSAGLNFLWADDHEKALPYFEKAVKKDPGYAEAYFYIGVCNAELGRYTEAIEAFKQAIRIKPDDAVSHYNLGYAYAKLGRHTEAIEAFKQTIRIKPDFADAHYNLGYTYAELGYVVSAIEAYKQAIRIKPDDAKTHEGLGAAYWKLGSPTEAIEAIKQAIRIKPDYAEAHYSLGVAYDQLGRYTEAIEAFKQAIRIKPGYADAHCNLGVTYGKLGRYREAIEAIKQAIRVKPDDAEAHYNLGWTYTKLGRHTEAIEAFKQAIRINPGDAWAHYLLGVDYLITKDRGSALEQYKILKNLDNDLANHLFNLIYK
jgi:tetratricopeptide (TPR) repeat protein